MIHLFNRIIKDSKRVKYSLNLIYGLNTNIIIKACRHLGINPKGYLIDLDSDLFKDLENYIYYNFDIEEKLKKSKREILDNSIKARTYKGLQKVFGLPCNGQRTHSNSKTCRKYKIFSINKTFNGKDISKNFLKKQQRKQQKKLIKKKLIKKQQRKQQKK
jgi:ribosomal protein S13